MRNITLLIVAIAAVVTASFARAVRADEQPKITHSFLALGGRTYIIEFDPAKDAETPAPAATAARSDILFEDFEKDTYDGWTATGTAFGPGPRVVADMPKYQGDVNARGKHVVNTHNTLKGELVGQGDAHVGTLTSKTFKIERDYITMLVGGGAHAGKTCVNIVVDGKTVASVTGKNNNRMEETAIDVRGHAGKEATIVIVDNETAGWGNIGVDQIVFTDAPKVAPPANSGKIVWQYPGSTRDGWVLPNGNVLLAVSKNAQYPGGAVVEVTRDQPAKVVFEFKGTQSEVNTCQRLANGNTMLTEAGNKPRILEVNPKGEIVSETPITCQLQNHHMQTRMSRKLPNGNTLVPHLFDKVVREYDPTGKIVWEAATPNWAFTAIRTPEGHTVVGCTYGLTVVELDKDGKIVWQLTNDDLPEPIIKDACGVQRLPNGNTVITSYGARGENEIKMFEVTPEKKVVWTHRSGFAGGIHHFQILDTNGKPLDRAAMK